MTNTEHRAQVTLSQVLNDPSNDMEQCVACDASHSWDNKRSLCPYHHGLLDGHDRAFGDMSQVATAIQADPELADMVIERHAQQRVHEYELAQRAENQPDPEVLNATDESARHNNPDEQQESTTMTDPRWAPAEQHVPHLLGDLMHMGTVRYSGRQIEQYKHIDTRNYLNLDHTGQAWEVAVDGATGAVGARRLAGADALTPLEGHSD